MAAQLQLEDLLQLVQALGAEEALGNLKVGDLKAYCKQYGLKAYGSKGDLVNTLGDYIKDQAKKAKAPKRGKKNTATAEAGPAAEAGPKAEKAKGKAAAKSAAKGKEKAKAPTTEAAAQKADAAEDTGRSADDLLQVLRALSSEELEETLQATKVSELRDHCKILGLSINGIRGTLVERLVARVGAEDHAEEVDAKAKEEQMTRDEHLAREAGDAARQAEEDERKAREMAEAAAKQAEAQAEQARQAEEEKRIEEERLAKEAAEAARQAEEERLAEEQRKAREMAEAAAKQAEEQAEQARQAEEEKRIEEERLAKEAAVACQIEERVTEEDSEACEMEEVAASQAEEAREEVHKAEEEEKQAEEEEESLAEEERKAREMAEAAAKQAEEEAEQARQAEEEKRIEEDRVAKEAAEAARQAEEERLVTEAAEQGRHAEEVRSAREAADEALNAEEERLAEEERKACEMAEVAATQIEETTKETHEVEPLEEDLQISGANDTQKEDEQLTSHSVDTAHKSEDVDLIEEKHVEEAAAEAVPKTVEDGLAGNETEGAHKVEEERLVEEDYRPSQGESHVNTDDDSLLSSQVSAFAIPPALGGEPACAAGSSCADGPPHGSSQALAAPAALAPAAPASPHQEQPEQQLLQTQQQEQEQEQQQLQRQEPPCAVATPPPTVVAMLRRLQSTSTLGGRRATKAEDQKEPADVSAQPSVNPDECAQRQPSSEGDERSAELDREGECSSEGLKRKHEEELFEGAADSVKRCARSPGSGAEGSCGDDEQKSSESEGVDSRPCQPCGSESSTEEVTGSPGGQKRRLEDTEVSSSGLNLVLSPAKRACTEHVQDEAASTNAANLGA